MGNVADDGATALYRLYDREGDLLYVGIAFDPIRRVFSEHEADKAWFVGVTTVKINWFQTRQRALANETRLIELLRPRHNIRHNQLRGRCENFPSCTEPAQDGRRICRKCRYHTERKAA